MKLAEDGPIVVLNVSQPRCDAIIITQDSITALPLPGLNDFDLKTKIESFATRLQQFRSSTYQKTQLELIGILQWVWDVAVSPVLDALGYKEPPKSNVWPHVWWIPTGWLTLIPLHAAGYHSTESSQNCLDRVISSYVPTIKSLSYARERKSMYRDMGKTIDQITFISMPETPSQAQLEYVDIEVATLDSVLPDNVMRYHLQNPEKGDVLAQLAVSQIVHFACHGNYDLTDPAQSMLLLEDWQTNPLSVMDFTMLNLDHVQLAYLSACHAAGNFSGDLLDEAIHLTGACQLAGFPSVVGTLWQINDKHSANVAADVYSLLSANGNTVDVGHVAEALHQAVRALRAKTQKIPGFTKWAVEPLIWAPYIHVGA